jgi:hypothetical protein
VALLIVELSLDDSKKVVDNYLVLLVLNFHDLKLDSLGVTWLLSLLLGFDCILRRSERCYCLI